MKDNKLMSWLRKQQWSGWRVENERFKFSTTFQIVVFLLRLEDWQKILKYIAEFPAKIVTVVQTVWSKPYKARGTFISEISFEGFGL